MFKSWPKIHIFWPIFIKIGENNYLMRCFFSPNFIKIKQKMWIFLLMANFWTCLAFFTQTLGGKKAQKFFQRSFWMTLVPDAFAVAEANEEDVEVKLSSILEREAPWFVWCCCCWIDKSSSILWAIVLLMVRRSVLWKRSKDKER